MDARITASFEAQTQVKPLQFIVAALGFLTVFIDSFATQTVAVAGPLLKQELAGGSKTLGFIFGMNMLGGLVGALLLGALGDRWGRRPLVIASLAIIVVGSLASAYASTAQELALLRFATGLGLGGALPNTVSLVAEYAPPRWRSRFTAMVFNGFPLGVIVGSIVGAQLVVSFGWRAVFLVGGAASAVVLLLVVVGLPESLEMLRRRGSPDAFARVTARLAGMAEVLLKSNESTSPPGKGSGLLQIFQGGVAPATILLSIATFLSMMSQYSALNWLPTLASEAGASVKVAINSITFLMLGGIIGNFILARIGDYASPYLATAIFYGVGGAVLTMLSLSTHNTPIFFLVSFIGGLLATGAQLSVTTITARLFDVNVRSSAIGWALAMGRVGAAVGPMVAGWALAQGMTFFQYMVSVGAVFLCAGAAVALLGQVDYVRRR